MIMEETKGKKVYLIDSENVGDVWVTHIMEFAEEQDEIVVFYTQKSPYMSYENIRKLMETDREIVFIKCVEGQNALDFQLVTELGYRIGNEPEDTEYVVVTNDTGFDAAVRYWKAQGKLVKRYNARFCQTLLTQHKIQMGKKTTQERQREKEKKEAEVKKAEEALSKGTEEKVSANNRLEEENTEEKTEEIFVEQDSSFETDEEKEEETETEETETEEMEETEADEGEEVEENEESEEEEELICSLLSCIGKKNIPDFHNALIIFLGQEKGKAVYKRIKGEISDYQTKKNMKEKEKFKVYCQLVFSQDSVEENCPRGFSNFVYDAREKRGNLNTFRAALLEKYGKEKGMIYYNIIKPHVKILNRMQKK